MVQETEYDDVITCKHSYSEKCHITYVTDYTPQQEEKCFENFKKNCFIEFKNQASEEKVQFCFTPLLKNCEKSGPEECTTEYTSSCTTRYHEHDVEDDFVECADEVEEKCESITQGYTTSEECTKWPVRKCGKVAQKTTKKYSPETECKKVPVELCGPGACPLEQGPEECQARTQTVVQEVPEETCNLEPQRICKHVTKLVPHLKATENCIDIPKEVCSRSRTNPRRVDKPVVKKWCYTPTGATPPPPPPRNGGRTPPPNNQGNGPPKNQGNGGDSKPKPCDPDYPTCTLCNCARKRNDGTCNPECNNPKCGNDGNDCDIKPTPPPSYLPPPKKGY
jgi:hypothetical protein